MAADDWDDDAYEAGRRDALAEAEEKARDKRMSYEQFQVIRQVDPGRAAREAAAGNVNFESSALGMQIQQSLLANRRDRAAHRKMFGEPDPGNPFPMPDAERMERMGFGEAER